MDMRKSRPRCPAECTLEVIGGSWKVPILWHLAQRRVMRFSELGRALDEITPKMLSQQLRELESDGLVHRKVYPQVPPKVEYSLTAAGQSLMPVVSAMCRWGEARSPRRGSAKRPISSEQTRRSKRPTDG
jgi:DNA-binding HxlR family transcriptional regulator